jgi:hypothetical protein
LTEVHVSTIKKLTRVLCPIKNKLIFFKKKKTKILKNVKKNKNFLKKKIEGVAHGQSRGGQTTLNGHGGGSATSCQMEVAEPPLRHLGVVSPTPFCPKG